MMKSRRISDALTMEDELIWDHCVWNPDRYPWRELRRVAFLADRRDADLMLFQMRLRASLKPHANYIRWMDLHPDIPL